MNHATHPYHPLAKPSHRARASRRRERGLTLVELMIGVVVGSILVGFVFDIHSRMSSAFRAQNNIGSLQQGIRAANELLARDARLAGFMMPDGFFVSSAFPTAQTMPGLVQGPDPNGIRTVRALTVFNNPAALPDNRMQPDRIHIFYADPDPNRDYVVVGEVTPTTVSVDRATLLIPGDLLLMVRYETMSAPPHPLGGNLPAPPRYHACVVMLTGTGPSPTGNEQLIFDASGAPFNTANNDHCFINAPSDQRAIVADETHVFRLNARAYRIDTNDPLAAPLQVSATGGLLGLSPSDWQVMGIGFVDLQITQRFVEEVSDGNDPDADGNPRMDWYASGPPFPANTHLTEMGISLVARTARSVEGVRAISVPVLSTGPRNNNPVGDAGGPKNMLASPEFTGDHIYRQSSMIVDTRNVGVAF
jgi:type IV pilus assembly protein PilW